MRIILLVLALGAALVLSTTQAGAVAPVNCSSAAWTGPDLTAPRLVSGRALVTCTGPVLETEIDVCVQQRRLLIWSNLGCIHRGGGKQIEATAAGVCARRSNRL